MKEQACSAEKHVSKCNGIGTSQDHFTPKCIAKLYGWKSRRISDGTNLQWLSWPCHNAKDKDTPLRKEVLQLQMKGKSFTFEEHQAIFKRGRI